MAAAAIKSDSRAMAAIKIYNQSTKKAKEMPIDQWFNICDNHSAAFDYLESKYTNDEIRELLASHNIQ